jgi:hypothetical protein
VGSLLHLPKTLANSRLVHFLAIGALVAALAPRERDDRRLVIDAARVDRALRAEQARLARPLTADEKQDAVSRLIEEEILAREAVRASLATEDDVVRARLAERMRTSLAFALSSTPPADEGAIAAETARIAERAPERVRLALWFVSRDRADAERRAETLGREIAAEGAAATRDRGDPKPLPDGALWTEEALARVAGPSVARAAMTAPIGRPTPPLVSAWGFYVLVPLERSKPDAPELRAEAVDAIRRRNAELDVRARIDRVRRAYDVQVSSPAGEPRFDPSIRPRRDPEGAL